MLDSLRVHIARLIAPSTRRFDAAAGGRRWDARPSFGSISPEVLAAAGPVRSRARYFYANNPWAKSGVDAWVTALIGSGITPASKHPDQAARTAIGQTFARMASRADADGLTDFGGLQAAAVRAEVVDGESFLHFRNTTDGPQLQLIPAEQVDAAHTVELSDGRRIVAGIEFDATGRRTAYHISPTRPTDTFTNYAPPVRVPAEDVIHLFRPLGPGQVRGISWLTPVLLRLSELDQLEDALLVGAKVAAMHAGFLIDQNGSAQNPYDGDQKGSVLDSGLEPGTLKYLPPGMDIKFSTPQQAQQSIEFAQLELRAVAAGLNLPEYLLTGDLRNANYSSLRAALVTFRQVVEALQYHTIIPQFCRPYYERAVAHAVLAGVIEAPDFEKAPSDYLEAEWYPPAQPWVDPQKDAEALQTLIGAGLMSRRQAVAERGYSVEELDEEIAADQARERLLGLSFGQGATKPAKQEPAPDDNPNPTN
jgi:lambda family phage portal protein